MRTFDEIQADVNHANGINDADALMNLATELDALQTPQAEAEASRSRGSVHHLRGDYTAAVSHYHRALALYEELGDRSGAARVTGYIGLVHENTGNYPEALSHHHRALALREELGERSGVAGTTCNIGIVYLSTGDYPEALSHFHRALAICDEIGHRHFAANITGNIGGVHRSTGDYPEALSHFHSALALHEELGNRSAVASVTGNIGLVHKSTGDYPEALSHYHRALALHVELGDRSGVAGVTSNIGLVHNDTGDYPEALSHFHSALALHEELGDRKGVAGVTGNIVGTYLAMGSDAEAQALLQTMDDMLIEQPLTRVVREHHRAALQERSGDLDGASVTLQHALSEALEHGLRSEAAEVHKALRDLAQKRNDFAAYIEHNNEYTRITEEINGKDATQKMMMQVKQREIDAVQREHAQHMAVLHSTLPKHIADRVARGEVVNDAFDDAAVLFLDIVSFTTNSTKLEPRLVTELLDDIFSNFDELCDQHNVTKIKTIGDAYLAVAFPADGQSTSQNIASVAIGIQEIKFTWPDNSPLQFRIGLHSGPVVAGVIGKQRLQYDVWGDTVNVASRMESSSEAGRIHVSETFYVATTHASSVGNQKTIQFIPRGEIEVKGKGTMQTYWLEEIMTK